MLTETPEFLSKVREAGYDGLVGYDEGCLLYTSSIQDVVLVRQFKRDEPVS